MIDVSMSAFYDVKFDILSASFIKLDPSLAGFK
jgi:hypothetical protein